jgi:hypothetical protein
MTAEEQQIQKQINTIWDELNTALEEFDNSLLLFDFTTVFYKGENYGKVQSTYRYAIEGYPQLLNEYFNRYGYSVQKQEDGESGEIIPDKFSVESPISELATTNPKNNRYDPGKDEEMTLVGLDTWHSFVAKKKFAAASWILFKDFFNDNSSSERIEVGVYILLKSPIKGWMPECQDSIELKHSEGVNKLLSDKAYKFLFNSGIGYVADEFKKRKEEIQRLELAKEQLDIKRSQQRTINHYLRPIFTGISLKAKDIQLQIDGGKIDDAKLSAKILQLQTEILEHHFKLGQRLDDIIEQDRQVEMFNISFECFFEYLYIRNFFTGSHIDFLAIKSLTDNEYSLVKEICSTSLFDFFVSEKHNFSITVSTIFSKLTRSSSFKLLFRGETSKLFFELPKSLSSMDVVIKFSSAFIENFKKFWMKDIYVSNTGNRLNSFLIIYANIKEIYFFQYKENQGYKEYVIDLPAKTDIQYETKFIANYTADFTEVNSESGLGNNDLKSLLKSNNIECSTKKKVVKIEYDEDGEQRIKDGYLYFKKLVLNKQSTLIKTKK